MIASDISTIKILQRTMFGLHDLLYMLYDLFHIPFSPLIWVLSWRCGKFYCVTFFFFLSNFETFWKVPQGVERFCQSSNTICTKFGQNGIFASVSPPWYHLLWNRYIESKCPERHFVIRVTYNYRFSVREPFGGNLKS